MGYAGYLRELLRPLGVYDHDARRPAGAETEALGAALDDFSRHAAARAKEMQVLSAEDEGLRRMEALFPFPAADGSVQARRSAISGFLQVSGDSFTPEALDRCLAACGIDCKTDENGGANTVGISFPGVMGEPDGLERKKKIIESILPCHLEPIYRLKWCSWADTEALGLTFRDLEDMTFFSWSMLEAA